MTSLGGGSIMAYGRRTGYAAYTWALDPDGVRVKRWVYGKNYEDVFARWRRLQDEACNAPPSPPPPRLDETALSIVCVERIPMPLTGPDRVEAVRRLTAKGLPPSEIANLVKTSRDVVTVIRRRHHIEPPPTGDWSWENYLYASRRR